MRDVYRDQLLQLADGLAEMCDEVATALDLATRSLLEADLDLAEQVEIGEVRIDALREQADAAATGMLLLQAPVATDLRSVVSSIHLASDLERMGDLALHVAKTAKRRHPARALPAEVAHAFAEMGRVGVALARSAAEVIRTRDLALAARMERDDDALDELHEHMFRVLTDAAWTHGVQTAIDVTLLARFYERYGDHAVSVARRVAYIVNGHMNNVVEPV